MKKNSWKIAAAVAFFTVAGLCYGRAAGFGGGAAGTFAVETEGPEEKEAGGGEIKTETGTGSAKDPAPGQETAAEQETSSGEDLPKCYVYVCGEVKVPGVYELAEGTRVFEAVKAAGGFTDEAAGESLNLAAKVTDGMKLRVPDREEAETFSEAAAGLEAAVGQEPGSSAGGRVNLNTATKEELMTLNGIGASRAEDILEYRSAHGSFRSIEEIMNISGIKDALFQKIKDGITV